MNSSFGNWLAGFVDGEGSFNVVKHKKPSGNEYYSCSFRVAVHIRDTEIIETIQRETGIGTISNSRMNGYGSGELVSWNVASKKDCRALVEILLQHPLRTQKQNDFVIWTKAVREIAMTDPGDERNASLAGLKAELQEGRRS